MKKIFFLAITVFALITPTISGCVDTLTVEYPENLIGTTWKCTEFPNDAIYDDLEYRALVFTSATEIIGGYKEKSKTATVKSLNGTYSLSNEIITITLDNGEKFTGIITGKAMMIPDDGFEFVFNQQ